MIDKAQVLQAFLRHIDALLDGLRRAQHDASDSATHEENRAESDKDTRATEASYLARGLAERVVKTQNARLAFSRLPIGRRATVDVGALVLIDDDDSERWVLVAPALGGTSVAVGDVEIAVVTPKSPLGRAIMRAAEDDEVTFAAPGGKREIVVVEVR